MPDLLPGYTFNTDTGRYRSTSTGRFVARRDIVAQLDAQIRHGEQRLASLTEAFHEGRLSASVWTEEMRSEIRRLHLQSAAQGAGGWDQLTARDFGRVGGKLQADYQRLVAFAAAVQSGEVTLPQALNRAGMYVGNARTQFWAAEREHRPRQADIVRIERRMLDVVEHCADCVRYYEQGWQMAGVLPEPGEKSACMSNCRCSLLIRDVPLDELDEWLGTKRG